MDVDHQLLAGAGIDHRHFTFLAPRVLLGVV
jgi:hypothetical protein